MRVAATGYGALHSAGNAITDSEGGLKVLVNGLLAKLTI